MQHNHNIENKLREMEAIEPPELGQMDAHWQQMAGMLQPTVIPVKKGWPQWMLNGFSAAAVVLLVGAAIWFLSSKKAGESKQDKVTEKESAPAENTTFNAKQTASGMFTKDTAITPSIPVIFHTASFNSSLINNDTVYSEPIQWTEQDSILGTLKLTVTDCLKCPGKTNDVAAISHGERQLRLQTLFTQLAKQEQHFTIDNRRDTLLLFEEGTALLIPANSLGGMNGVEITAKEFYKTSDIVLNQLSTASNKEQLETGGMIFLQARLNNKPVLPDSIISLKLFMSDTSSRINGMQLFYGGKMESDTSVFETANLNWIPQGKYFSKRAAYTEARVLNLVNMPYKIKETKKGQIAYFLIDDSITVSKDSIKEILKRRYGYYKIRLVNAEWWEIRSRKWGSVGYFDSYYASRIGDSIWMEKSLADDHKLQSTAIRTVSGEGSYASWIENVRYLNTRLSNEFNKKIQGFTGVLQNKCGVDIMSLGWINCDRFYKAKHKKIMCLIDLGDSAANYSTMIVFEKIKSIMTGHPSGNKVSFSNIPAGEPVKIISIGINPSGETVYSVTHTTTSEQELKGLQFQATSVPDLKASLSKFDK